MTGTTAEGQEVPSQTDQTDVVERLDVRPSQAATTPALTSHNVVRARHWRFWLGLFEVASGLLAGLVTVANTRQIQDMETSNALALTQTLAVIMAFGSVSIAGIVIGTWNLATLRGTVRLPLIAAITVSAASVVLTMAFVGGPPFDPVKIGWAALHTVVSLWTVGILRLKKVPAP